MPQIALVKSSREIVIFEENDVAEEILIAEEAYWPVWMPTGAGLSLSLVNSNSGTSTVEMFDTDGNYSKNLFQTSTDVQPVIAPEVPHFCLPAPTGDFLATIAPGKAGLTLYVTEINGLVIGDPILSGAPLFVSWSPDGDRLAVHSGLNLSVLELRDGRASIPVSADARGFRVAAWTPKGELIFAEPLDSQAESVAIRMWDQENSKAETLYEIEGGVAFSFRPGTGELNFARTRDPETGVFDSIWSLNLEKGESEPKQWVNGPVSSFFWSPNGEKLAVIRPAPSGSARYAVSVVDSNGTFLGATEPFTPSTEMQTMFAFFDQYELSHRLWSPDSGNLLVSGRLHPEGPAPAFFGTPEDSIFSWPPKKFSPFERIAAGRFACYA